MSNGSYDPGLGADLYNRYLDEKVYAEEMGFDGLMLNEHHSTPFCMGGVMNVEAAILARITKRAKIVLLGNVLPIWDDPLWLAEKLAEIDMISRGRLVSGWVRGTGRESVAHNAQPPFNWERFQEAHDFIVKAWTKPGPFRWEGEHYHYRYVNPWARPYQDPHPPIWIPGVMSRNTVEWSAKHRYPYVMLATELEPTKAVVRLLRRVRQGARLRGRPPAPRLPVQGARRRDRGAGRARRAASYVEGPSNPFLEGNQGNVKPVHPEPAGPDVAHRTCCRPSSTLRSPRRGGQGVASRPRTAPIEERGRRQRLLRAADREDDASSRGTPKTVIPKIRTVLETCARARSSSGTATAP